MIALWALLQPALAVPVTRNVKICINYDTEYDDADADGIASEDFWADNAVDRWARGVEIVVVDDNSSTVMYTSDADGCVSNVLVDVETSNGEKLEVVVRSRAEVQGVPYEVHQHTGAASWSNQPIRQEYFSAYATEVTIERTTSPALAWQVMAAVSWMFHRSQFAIDEGVSRSCCLEGTGGAGADGTCTNPSLQYGGPFTGTLHYFVRSDSSQCGGGNNQPDNHLNSVEFAGNCRSKFLYAHENGHLIVGMRMNGIEQYSLSAPLDDCMADTGARQVQVGLPRTRRRTPSMAVARTTAG